MKKILWHSEFFNKTGFAKVSRNLVKHLKKDFDITVLDWQKQFDQEDPLSPIDIDGFKVLGKLNKSDNEFATLMLQAINLNEYDCIFFICDSWIINELCKLLKHIKYKGKVVCYFPVDANYHDPEWYSDFDIVSIPVTYTQFAKKEIISACPEMENILIIPHGTDTGVFYPYKETKQAIREKLFRTDRFNDSFIILNANRNQPRKRLDITLEGFSIFAQDKSDVMLYMHCKNTDSSMDIERLADRFGILGKMMNSDRSGLNGVSEANLSLLYNSCDIGIQTSMGEGWGLTNTEMAATGKPQLVPQHSACNELFGDVMDGYMIQCSGKYTFDNIMTVGDLVSPQAVAEQLEKIYQLYISDPQEFSALSYRCFEKFTAPEYLWENISKQWKSLFESL